MKANDSIHILSLPLNTSYTIKEVDSGSASKSDYKFKYRK